MLLVLLLGQRCAVSLAQDRNGKAEEPVVLVVAQDGTGDYRSIQAAVDAAPPGGLVRIEPGTYRENLVIKKPLTLEGAGPERTTVAPATVWTGSISEFILAYEELQRSAAASAESLREREEFAASYERPILLVAGTRVALQNLKFTALSPDGEGVSYPSAVVSLSQASAKLSNCIVTGSWGDGIQVGAGSSLEIRDSLVAATMRLGIRVGREATVRILGTDVRGCTTGVEARVEGSTLAIEGCRFLDSDFSAIIYEETSPLVRGNVVSKGGKGILAGGSTEAVITGNVFYACGRSAIWVVHEAVDVIENNTFAANDTGVFVPDADSRPVIGKNVFFRNRAGVVLASPTETETVGDVATDARLEGNIFWRNRAHFRSLIWRRTDGSRSGDERDAPLPAGNEVRRPGLRDPRKLDFTLRSDSFARKKGIGALDPLSLESPWPEQPEEVRMRQIADEAVFPPIPPGLGVPGRAPALP